MKRVLLLPSLVLAIAFGAPSCDGGSSVLVIGELSWNGSSGGDDPSGGGTSGREGDEDHDPAPNPDNLGEPVVIEGPGQLRICKRRSSDGVVWFRIGTPEEDVSTAIAVDSSGRVYVGGWTEGAIEENHGQKDMIVMALEPYEDPPVVWTRQDGTIKEDWVNAISLADEDSLLVVGSWGTHGGPGVVVGEGGERAGALFVLNRNGETAGSYFVETWTGVSLGGGAVLENGDFVTWGIHSPSASGVLPGVLEGGRYAMALRFSPDGSIKWLFDSQEEAYFGAGILHGDRLVAGGYVIREREPSGGLMTSISLDDGESTSLVLQGEYPGPVRVNDIVWADGAVYAGGKSETDLYYDGDIIWGGWMARVGDNMKLERLFAVGGVAIRDLVWGENIMYGIVRDNDTIFGPFYGIHIVGIDPGNGTIRWEKYVPYGGNSVFMEDMAIRNGKIYVTGSLRESSDGCPPFGDRDIFLYVYPVENP